LCDRDEKLGRRGPRKALAEQSNLKRTQKCTQIDFGRSKLIAESSKAIDFI
jgi:hypothetical protein